MSQKKHQDDLDLDKTFKEEFNRAEHFFEKNRKAITYVVVGLIVVIGGYIGYREMILGPKEHEGQVALAKVQRFFAQDSFNLVLNGNGVDMGALDIIDEYGMTKAANLAHFYAGVSYMKMGQYEDAIDELKSFSSDEQILGPQAIGLIGDSYAQLKEYNDAADWYMKAAQQDDNNFTAPFYLKKAGLAYENANDYDKAVSAYSRIKDDYKKSVEAGEIQKYIFRAKAKTGSFE